MVFCTLSSHRKDYKCQLFYLVKSEMRFSVSFLIHCVDGNAVTVSLQDL